MQRSRRSPIQELFSSLTLRGKLTAVNMGISLVIMLVMGIYIYLRIQDGSNQLVLSVEENARQRAEADLFNLNSEQASRLGSFFQGMSGNTGVVANSIRTMLIDENLSNSNYWDANSSLERLPNGSWDNSNSETSSIFIPSAVNLNAPLIRKLNLLKHAELVLPSILEENPDVLAIYFGGESKETIYFPNIDLANIVPPDFDVTGRQWYISAAPDNNPSRTVVWSTPYEDAALNGLVITTSVPVFDETDRFQGVAAMDVQITRIIDLLSSIQIGETGYAFLMDDANRLISLPDAGYLDFEITDENAMLSMIMDPSALPSASPAFYEVLNRVSTETSGIFSISVAGKERYVAFNQIPEVGYKIVFIVSSEELLPARADIADQVARETRNSIISSILLVLFVLGAAAALSLSAGKRLTAPLNSLNEAASEFTKGNFNARADIRSGDELEMLAGSFNRMSDTVKDLVLSLEQRVRERTVDLEKETVRGQKRSKQYEAVARVAQAINVQKNLRELLPQVTEVISDQFGFYHVGIFLNDALGKYAVLVAANSEGGKRMLERGHQLRIGEQGIVGYVTDAKKPRIALSVGEDAVFFNNPDLPETQSEMALPLIESDNSLGALDVQSREINAFSEEDLESLTILADLVGIAIHNAKLYEQMERSLAEAEAASRRFLRENWNRLADEFKMAGYRYTASGVRPLGVEDANSHPQEDADRKEISTPILVRGQALGELVVSLPKDTAFNSDQMDTIKAVADRVAVIAENARLFDETQRRAERERLVTDITTKIRGTNDPQEMIETALKELREALKVSRIDVIPQKSKSPDR